MGEHSDAVADYRDAARMKNEEAVDRLIELLEHDKCGIRASAALALGDAKVKSARSALEHLAEKGGPNEDEAHLLGGLLGCSSKDAAKRALERLE